MFKQKLPKFPIKFQHSLYPNETLVAFFKPTGDPKSFKVIIKTKSDTFNAILPAPLEEVMSWRGVAMSALAQLRTGSRHLHTLGVQKMPGAQYPPSKSSGIIFVKNAILEETYHTAQSTDPEKQYLCRLVGPSKTKEHFILSVYFPNLREWQEVEVKDTYLLKINSKERKPMPTKPPAAPVAAPKAVATKPVPVVPKPATKETVVITGKLTNGKKSVPLVWGEAFQKFGTAKDAPTQIVGYLKKNLPNKTTDWSKWVNTQRILFNAGKLPVAAPKVKIEPYR